MQNNFVQQVWRLYSSAIRFSSSPRYFFMTKGTNKQKIWWYSDTIIINGRVFRTPYFMKTPCILFIFPFLKFYPTTPLFLLLCFFGWMCHKVSSCHIQCVILIHDFMDLNLLGLRWCLITSSTLLCVLWNKASNLLKVLHWWHGFCYYSDLISNTQTNTHTGHAGTNRLTNTYEYI